MFLYIAKIREEVQKGFQLLNETVNVPWSKGEVLLICSQRYFLNEFVFLFYLSFLWLSIDLKSDSYNLTFISFFSVLVDSHQGSFYICSKINSWKRKMIEVQHSAKQTVAVEWGSGEMSSIDLNWTQPLWEAQNCIQVTGRSRPSSSPFFMWEAGKRQAQNIQDKSYHLA